jgi:SagB-type dehydrogenase family enzyme
MKEKTQLVFRYHERTKHHPGRYARSPGYLDWANEPDPFRRYEGAVLLSLPFIEKDPGGGYHNLYERGGGPPQPFTVKSVSAFLELSLGLSAWKSYHGTRWALRINPSSGNLHPTEAHLILPPLPENGGRGGVCHYSPFLHALEVRAAFDAGFWLRMREHFGTDGFFVGLSSIYWRESWKYGERAFRYCNHDVGHAMAALSFAGNLLGWKATYLDALSDKDVATLLGFRKTSWTEFEAEYPEVLLFVHANAETAIPRDMPQGIIDSFQALSYSGEPSRLSKDHRDWGVIEEVSAASEKPRTPAARHRCGERPFFGGEPAEKQAAAVIRQRRSALAFDGRTALKQEYFFGMLDRTVPRGNSAPFDLGAEDAEVHLLIFVHRVCGLEAGLYFLIRDDREPGEIRRRCRPDFLWERMNATAGSMNLYLLKRGDFRSEGAAAG